MDDADVVASTLLMLFQLVVVLPCLRWVYGRQLLGKRAVERQLRDLLPDARMVRLARGPYPKVHLAVIQRGGMWAVDAWNALRRQRQRAAGAVALARGWAEGRVIVGRRLDEDALVEELIDALEDVSQGWEAARLLAGFDRPQLGRDLVLRFGDDLPPPARRLRRRLLEQGGGRGAVSLVDPVGGALALAEG